MNIQASPASSSTVTAPPAPRTLADTGLSSVMMRDILLKTMFRTNLYRVSEIAVAVSLPVNLTQDLVDQARRERGLGGIASRKYRPGTGSASERCLSPITPNGDHTSRLLNTDRE